MRRPSVFIVNKSAHDFAPAKKFGNLVFMSEGSINRYSTNNMHRKFIEAMKNSRPTDYIIPCSLNVMNCIACAIFAKKHNRLNLLLFKEGSYLERTLVL